MYITFVFRLLNRRCQLVMVTNFGSGP